MKTQPIQYPSPEVIVAKNLVLSIKPEYALKIIEGKKTVELRRRFPVDNIKGGIAIIYASSPIQKIIGYTIIEDVKKKSVSSIWEEFKNEAHVTKRFFNNYFKGLEEGFAVILSHPIKLPMPIDIKELEQEDSFSPPQSYSYASAKILEMVDI